MKFRTTLEVSSCDDLELGGTHLSQWIILKIKIKSEILYYIESRHDELEGTHPSQWIILKIKIKNEISYYTGGIESRRDDLDGFWLNFILFLRY